jgi:hypothetical protein
MTLSTEQITRDTEARQFEGSGKGSYGWWLCTVEIYPMLCWALGGLTVGSLLGTSCMLEQIKPLVLYSFFHQHPTMSHVAKVLAISITFFFQTFKCRHRF